MLKRMIQIQYIFIIICINALIYSPAIAQINGNSFLGRYYTWPDKLTVEDERNIAHDVRAVCIEALSALVPLNQTEVAWLDQVAPKGPGGRMLNATTAEDRRASDIILQSSAYMRDLISNNLRLCVDTIGLLFPEQGDALSSFQSRWSALLYTLHFIKINIDIVSKLENQKFFIREIRLPRGGIIRFDATFKIIWENVNREALSYITRLK
jgi:hypothetical protein